MRRIAGPDAAHGRVAAALFAADGHPALAVLHSGCTGRTAELARELPAELARLWALFAALGDALETGADVDLDADGLPVAGTGAAPARPITAADLVHDLDGRAAALLRELAAVEAAWAAVAGRIAAAETALARAERLADDLGAEPPARLQAAMAEARRRDLAAPAARVADGRLTPGVRGRLDRLDALAAATLAELETLARFRDDFPDRAAALHAAVDELAVAETGAAREFAVARAKIAETGLPTPPRAAPVLRARLRQVDGYARHRQWPRAVDGYAAVSAALTAARQRTAELRAAASGLLQRRDELRGRLESYRMKAAAAGFAEDDRLAERHDQARQLLYTAPCDLRAATRAVHAYRAALAELSEEGR